MLESLQQRVEGLLVVPDDPGRVSLGLAVVVVLAFSEAMLGLGRFVSGVLLVGISMLLVSIEPQVLPQILGLAFIGALSADLLGYGIGYRLSDRIMDSGLMTRYRAASDRFHQLVERSMLLAVCAGRLTPFLRSITPFLAGSLGVQPWRFLLFDLIACSIWVTGLGAILLFLPGGAG